MTDKKDTFEEYKKTIWDKADNLDFQSFMIWYERYLKQINK